MTERNINAPSKKVIILPIATKEDMIRSEAVSYVLYRHRTFKNKPSAIPTIFEDDVREKIARIREWLDRFDTEITDTCDEYIDPLDSTDIFSTFPYTLVDDPLTLIPEIEAQEIYSNIHTTVRPKPKE